jgi:hypothetical protein
MTTWRTLENGKIRLAHAPVGEKVACAEDTCRNCGYHVCSCQKRKLPAVSMVELRLRPGAPGWRESVSGHLFYCVSQTSTIWVVGQALSQNG